MVRTQVEAPVFYGVLPDTIDIAVMGHHSRAARAFSLADSIGAHISLDEFDQGENATGDAAWDLIDRGVQWGIVVQDDAILVPDFAEQAARALALAPEENCVSFYVGTGRPLGPEVSWAVERAEYFGAAWLQAPTLLWGVAVAMPTMEIDPFLDWASRVKMPYDERIGQWFKRQGRPIYYTYPCLADHDESLPSVLDMTTYREPRERGTRHAHKLGIPETWDTTVVPIPRHGARLS